MHDIVIKIIESKLLFIEVFKRIKKHRLTLIGAIIILVLVLVAILAPFISPNDPIKQDLPNRLLSPNTEYLLGTDNLGRCILSRLIHGARISLQIGVLVVTITSIIGIILGLTAGYYGGLIDEFIMRIVDILLAFPGIILALVIAGILGPSLYNVMLALALIGWTSYTRVVRGSVFSVKEKEFVEAARALGAGRTRVMFRHILPNVMAPVIVMATLGIAHMILAAAALSFLGLGAQPPIPEWGAMLNDGRAFIRTAPHLTVFPGLAIMTTVLAFNFLGDGLRDVLDPRLNKAGR
jgi:peptide/nickel transport system permease protein